MPRIEEGIEITCPVGKASAFTTDAGSWNKWQTILPEAVQSFMGPVGIGTTLEGTSRLMGRTMPWTARATEYEPEQRFGKSISPGSVLIEQHNTYTPTDAGLKFTTVYDITVN